jgi:hypothetical protein
MAGMITLLRLLVVAFLVWVVFNCGYYAYTERSGHALLHLSANVLVLAVLLHLWWRDFQKQPARYEDSPPSAH